MSKTPFTWFTSQQDVAEFGEGRSCGRRHKNGFLTGSKATRCDVWNKYGCVWKLGISSNDHFNRDNDNWWLQRHPTFSEKPKKFLIISIFKYGSLGMISIQYSRLGKRVFGLEIFELILILCLDKTTLMTSSIEILVRFVYMCIINTHIICMLFILQGIMWHAFLPRFRYLQIPVPECC